MWTFSKKSTFRASKSVKMAIFETPNFATVDFTWNLNGRKFMKCPHCDSVISTQCTVWNFQDFSFTLNLREINFSDSKSAKNCHFCHFKGCEFCSFGDFQPSKSAQIHKKSKFRPSNCVKIADFALLKSLKLISRKICVIEKY